ncbi:tRNA lysidine(34) synthetase TilS [Parathalassolituus penaei]|uniref:tRNA(Ile)-lysidine synthase n=1 Tax=Parathalassolituus penaei TaxID=2997323 RepID=A0A9X3EEG2_9GAMM|nr:tRNA lysidine(34) synthetase TilS [Parathalassolituus penaei]MCY0966072.1 tRNA lysidine(34) synthetase TilS [Parathalassolituus penaei]
MPVWPDSFQRFLKPLATDDSSACSGFWVGFSGGLDSLVLLHWLVQWRDQFAPHLPIAALHVHHGLSPNADAWAEFCQKVCASLQVPLQVERVQVRNQGDGIEDAARVARYQVYQRYCAANSWLLLGHHADDQLETLLMRLRRGTGLAGLAGMRAQRWLDPSRNIRIGRPLLEVSRQQLADWADAQGWLAGRDWVEDESNQDVRYERNWWRQYLLPLLESQFPGVRAPLLRSRARLQADAEALQWLVAERLAQCEQPNLWPLGASTCLQLNAVNKLPAFLHLYLLRAWLASHGCLPGDEAVLRDLWRSMEAAEDRQPLVRLGSWQVRRHRGLLYLLPAQLPEILVWPLREVLPASMNWAGGALLISPVLQSALQKHAQWQLLPAAGLASGCVIRMVGRPAKRLSQLWQERGVPLWLRDLWPVLANPDGIILVAGLAVSADSGLDVADLSWQCAEPVAPKVIEDSE